MGARWASRFHLWLSSFFETKGSKYGVHGFRRALRKRLFWNDACVSCCLNFYLPLMIFMGYFCDSDIIFNAEVSSINSITAWKAQAVADARPTPASLMWGLFPSLESLIALEYMMYSVHSDHFSNVWGGEQAHQHYRLQSCLCVINSQSEFKVWTRQLKTWHFQKQRYLLMDLISFQFHVWTTWLTRRRHLLVLAHSQKVPKRKQPHHYGVKTSPPNVA